MSPRAAIAHGAARATAMGARASHAVIEWGCRIYALPMIVGGAVLICAVVLWLGLREVISGQIERIVMDRAESLRATILDRTAIQELGLRRLAFIIGRYGEPNVPTWNEDARRIITNDGFRRVRWIDSALMVRRVVSRARDAEASVASRITGAEEIAAFRMATTTRRSASTNPVTLAGNVAGRVTFVPIVTDGRVIGMIAGDIDVDAWLGRTIGGSEGDGFVVELTDGARVLTSRGGTGRTGSGAARWRSEVGLAQQSSRWRLRVSPTEQAIVEDRLITADLVLLAGAIIALLLATSVRMAQRAGWRAAEHARATRRLEREIAERERAQQALRERDEQLQHSQKMEAVGRLAGGIAHDFNNLLTAISGFADFLLADIDRSDPRRDDVREIKRASMRAAALTGQLLAFSRRQIRQPKSLDLNAVVTDTQRMLVRIIGEDIKLATSLDPQLGTVHADPGQIEQVILNLVVNAGDAMPNGGTISITSRNGHIDDTLASRLGLSPGRYVMLKVADTGAGMDATTQARVFEPFFTTKEKGRGTGLGLSMVYAIVTSHGGTITVDSEVGQGTVFLIYLPRHDAPAEAFTSGVYSHTAPRGTETVLLAEDEDGVRALTVRILERHGYTVLEAGNGNHALAVAAQHDGPIHLLLTDVVMPEMGGRQLAEAFTERRPETQVLYISGYTDGEISRRGELDANTAFLQKPFTAPALLSKVRDVLDEKIAEVRAATDVIAS
jgi:signal transduction histidine kinase/ActR/RegA family two-component response regulator